MSDSADLAYNESQFLEQFESKRRLPNSTLAPMGYCHHCDEELIKDKQLFCDSVCSTNHSNRSNRRLNHKR